MVATSDAGHQLRIPLLIGRNDYEAVFFRLGFPDRSRKSWAVAGIRYVN